MKRPASLSDVPAFEDVLDVNILVVSQRLGNQFLRVSNNETHKNIYLYLVEDEDTQHFHAIANIGGFFSSHYFCENCLKSYYHIEYHSCTTTCIISKANDECRETDTQMSCRSCHMTSRSLECFHRHTQKPVFNNGKRQGQTRGPSECEKWNTCHKVLLRDERKLEDHQWWRIPM